MNTASFFLIWRSRTEHQALLIPALCLYMPSWPARPFVLVFLAPPSRPLYLRSSIISHRAPPGAGQGAMEWPIQVQQCFPDTLLNLLLETDPRAAEWQSFNQRQVKSAGLVFGQNGNLQTPSGSTPQTQVVFAQSIQSR